MVHQQSRARWLVASMIGAIAGIVLLAFRTSEEYHLLCLIPFTYALFNFFFPQVHTEEGTFNCFGVFFHGIMLMRAVLMPLLLAIGGFANEKPVGASENMPRAILLYAYEMATEYAFFAYQVHKKAAQVFEERNFFQRKRSYFLVLCILFTGILVCYFLCPDAADLYRTIFGITDYGYTGFDSRYLIKQSVTNLYQKFGIVTFRYLVNISRLLIPAIVIIKMKERGVKKRTAGTITALAIFAADFLLVDDTIASSLINALITVTLFSELFGRPRELPKYFFVSFLGVAAYFAIRMVLTKNEPGHMGEGIFTRISNTAQAYFCGINNIAAGFNLKTQSVSETIKYAVYEVLKGIPYATTIFGLDSTNISTVFNDINGTVGQIEPTISSGLLYFGPVLAPIYSLIFTSISFFTATHVRTCQNPLKKMSLIIICVYSLVGISMYSPEATWSYIFSIGVPILIISRLVDSSHSLSGRERRKTEQNQKRTASCLKRV